MRGRIIPILSVISLFGALFMLNYTTPKEAGVLGVLVFFTMIFMVLFELMVQVVKIFQKILKDKSSKGREISDNKRYMYALVLAFGPIIMLVSRSTRVTTWLLATVFVIFGCFLIYKRA